MTCLTFASILAWKEIRTSFEYAGKVHLEWQIVYPGEVLVW